MVELESAAGDVVELHQLSASGTVGVLAPDLDAAGLESAAGNSGRSLHAI